MIISFKKLTLAIPYLNKTNIQKACNRTNQWFEKLLIAKNDITSNNSISLEMSNNKIIKSMVDLNRSLKDQISKGFMELVS